MKRLLTAALFCLLSFLAGAQSFRATYYADNIIKLTWLPGKAAWHNENVSDAVLLKPIINKKVSLQHDDGAVVVAGKVHIAPFDSADYRGLAISLAPNEKIFGGGERALPLNRRGYRLPLYNNPWYGYGEGADALNYSVPFITSSAGYGLFFDNPSRGFLDIGRTKPDVLEYGAVSGEINVYIIFGDYATILQSYHKLTGTQPLPPRWALGNLMSRFGYTSEAQVRDIYGKMKDAHIPVDGVIFDLFWFGDSIKGTLGNLDWVNRKAWPTPQKMIADFKKEGVNTILVTEPYFVEGTNNYRASKSYLAVDSARKPYYLTDFYFGHGGLLDIFRADSKAFFWQFYKKQMQAGVEGWWGDLGEPERHPSSLYHNLKDLGYKRLFSADEVHNIYGHNWTKMLYEQYAKDFPNKRLFSLNRSGFAGTQRYSIFPWTGDVSRSWTGFRAQLPVLLGMSMSGVPYVHSDAGGFAGGEGDGELYVRWLQFAAFTPIFRPHGTALYEVDPAAFSFPSEPALMEEPWRSLAKECVETRYAFLPYNYSLAYQQARYGSPLMAPLYYHFPDDTMALHVEDEFMWGPSILVAPVLEKNARTRRYYLPAVKWFDIQNKKFLTGGTWRNDSVTAARFPLLYREGAFITMNASPNENTSKYRGDSLAVMYVFSENPSSFEWYNDDGFAKNALARKQYELIHFSSTGLVGNKMSIRIKPKLPTRKGKFVYLFLALPNGKPKKILINGISLSEAAGLFLKMNEFMYSPQGIVAFKMHGIRKATNIELNW